MKAQRIHHAYVEVTPDVWRLNIDSVATMRERLSQVRAQIMRHCDAVETANVVLTMEDYCTICNTPWDTYPDGMPGCCEKAADEWLAAQAAEKQP